MDLQTPLRRVKGLGSAKHGTGHWLAERITSIALIPLVIWFVVIMIQVATSDDSLLSTLYSPFNTIMMVLFLSVSLYHGALGMQVVIEDYVHIEWQKMVLIIGIQLVAVTTGIAAIVAILTFHIVHLLH